MDNLKVKENHKLHTNEAHNTHGEWLNVNVEDKS